jgi:hypothetical protein
MRRERMLVKLAILIRGTLSRRRCNLVALDDLAAATNELARILVHQELTAAQFREATGIACKALNGLYNDPEFELAFISLRTIADREFQALTGIISEVDHFTNHFLRRELVMLETEFRIDPCLLHALRSAARDLREAVRAENPGLVVIKQRIAALRDEACSISAGVKRILEAPARRNNLIRYTLAGVGGVAVIANHTPIGLSYFSPAGTAASWKLGLGLISIGGTGLYERLLEKLGAAFE